MGRKRSEIIEKDGVRYRLTPYNPDLEAQIEAWMEQNYCTVSTRIPRKARADLQRYCTAHGVTAYKLLRRYIMGVLEVDGG